MYNHDESINSNKRLLHVNSATVQMDRLGKLAKVEMKRGIFIDKNNT